MTLRVLAIALRCLVLGQYEVRWKSVEKIPWISNAINSLSVARMESRDGHLRGPLPAAGRRLRVGLLVESIYYRIPVVQMG